MTSSGHTWTISGSLTMREVPDVWREHRSEFAADRLPATVDLSRVDRVDSSALALLLEWQAAATMAGEPIRFREPSKSLRVIAGLTGVDTLLGWNGDGDPSHDPERTS